MLIGLVSTGFDRWPTARAVEVGGRYLVASGGPREYVLPLGVSRDLSFGNTPVELSISLHQMHEKLFEISSHDEPVAARLLAEYCRRFPVPLLCVHGLPHRHLPRSDADNHRPDSERSCRVPMHDGRHALVVADVIRMVAGLTGLQTLAHHVAHQRKPASPRMVENALTWPLLDPTIAENRRAQCRTQGELNVELCRSIITASLEAAFDHAAVVFGFSWTRNRRLEGTLHTWTSVGAYLADFSTHIMESSSLDDVDRTTTCVACGQPYQPRGRPENGSSFCQRPECQRERKRRNKARERAAKAKARST